jgi:hypothetical protein
MESTTHCRVLRASDMADSILPSSKLTTEGQDKRIVIPNVNLAVVGCFASIVFDRAVTIVQAQTGQEVAVVSAGAAPTIVLYNNTLVAAIGTITIAKDAAQLEKDTVTPPLATPNIAIGNLLNCAVAVAADTSGLCTLMIVYRENPA